MANDWGSWDEEKPKAAPKKHVRAAAKMVPVVKQAVARKKAPVSPVSPPVTIVTSFLPELPEIPQETPFFPEEEIPRPPLPVEVPKDPLIEHFDSSPYPNKDTWEPYIRDSLRPLKEKGRTPLRILCVGCGTGQELAAIQGLFGVSSVIGIEPSPKSAAIARVKAPYAEVFELCLSEAHTLGTFDLVVCQRVIEYLPDPAAAMRQLAALCNAQGRLWLGVYSSPKGETLQASPGHPAFRCLSWAQLDAFVRGSGFQIVKNGHGLPVPRNSLTRSAYSIPFLYQKRSMLYVSLQRGSNYYVSQESKQSPKLPDLPPVQAPSRAGTAEPSNGGRQIARTEPEPEHLPSGGFLFPVNHGPDSRLHLFNFIDED